MIGIYIKIFGILKFRKKPQSLKESFEEQIPTIGFVCVSPDGKLFNGSDGNHRLLTLMIKHFAERNSVKTEKN